MVSSYGYEFTVALLPACYARIHLSFTGQPRFQAGPMSEALNTRSYQPLVLAALRFSIL